MAIPSLIRSDATVLSTQRTDPGLKSSFESLIILILTNECMSTITTRMGIY